ncbi:biotin carboxylase [Microbacterium hydrocarbonoxydans]|uniref:biotin carboxylase n=1 Tax=Microbacterium hydrocarbonoxydans TaxID=273678 RepID=UPI0007BB8472|nr:biotin carboxylase [Microbacterium hydrocarbonoxydans]GAT72958.1 biotin carboxylase-like protein [Microbacterium sp. HM58-2]
MATPRKTPAKRTTTARKTTASRAKPGSKRETVPPVDLVTGPLPTAEPTLDAEDLSGEQGVVLEPPAITHALRNMSEIRHYFRTNRTPVFFVGASAFNLLGLDRWVRGFSYIAYYDSWQGAHPRVFSPIDKPYVDFQSGEEINNWLLRHHEVRAHIARLTPAGERPRIAMVFFDEETEAICEELGFELILPPAKLREHLDSKMVTTRIADSVGVASVPNIITTVDSWADVVAAAEKAGLGTDLVIQTAYGDSGKTTFFVTDESGYDRIADDLRGVEVKIMKRINNRPIAVEAVLTRHGTIVGPFMTEITGHGALTPYRGGWSGNEMFPGVLETDARHRATQLVRRLGDRLGQEGYRGFFEVDVLLDTDTGEVYLGELNPRISGASAITNVTAGAYADVPLFVFHLLEFAGVEFTLDVDEINERWEELAAADVWSHMVIKHTVDTVEHIDVAPPTGRYVYDLQGRLVFSQGDLDWHLLHSESEAFYLRIYGPGDYRWKGADLGILVTKGRLQTPAGELTIRAKHLIDSVRAMYAATPLPPAEVVEVAEHGSKA